MMQSELVAKHLTQRYLEGKIEAHEVAIAVLSLERAGKISKDDIKPILLAVFFMNPAGVLRALEKARPFLSKEFIDEVITSLPK